MKKIVGVVDDGGDDDDDDDGDGDDDGAAVRSSPVASRTTRGHDVRPPGVPPSDHHQMPASGP